MTVRVMQHNHHGPLLAKTSNRRLNQKLKRKEYPPIEPSNLKCWHQLRESPPTAINLPQSPAKTHPDRVPPSLSNSPLFLNALCTFAIGQVSLCAHLGHRRKKDNGI